MNELILQNELSDSAIVDTITRVYAVQAQSVSICGANELLANSDGNTSIFIQRASLPEGQFRQQLDIYVTESKPDIDVAIQFAATYDINVLVSDETPNPYRWVLVEPSGISYPVFLAVDEFDREQPRIVIDRRAEML